MMLDKARRLIVPSQRSDVPPFIVMDVMAAAARIEAAGGRVVHMEVGQPAAPAPQAALAAAQVALAAGRTGHTPAPRLPPPRARRPPPSCRTPRGAVPPAPPAPPTRSS